MESLRQSTLREIRAHFDADGDGKFSDAERKAASSRLNFAFSDIEPTIWKVDGRQREALIHLPTKKSNGGSPVVFVFHGAGGNAMSMSHHYPLHKHWPQALVVYMQALAADHPFDRQQGQVNRWQNSPRALDGRDLTFFDAVLKTLRQSYDIDENRYYAAGNSSGGQFTYLLWCERPDVFAAIAVNAAAYRGLRIARPKPIPVMHVAGRSDTYPTYRAQRRMMELVRENNGCKVEAATWGDVCRIYRSPVDANLVAFTHPGGHARPDVAIPLMVRFFKESEATGDP